MNRKPGAKPQGEIRQSQVVMTFGPGAMLDLPNHSVLIAGLDFWSKGGQEIIEPRLTDKLAKILDIPTIRLFTPPTEPEDPTAPSTGIDCFQFPEWFITQDVESIVPESSSRSRMLVRRNALTRGKFIDRNRKKRAVVQSDLCERAVAAISGTLTGTASFMAARPIVLRNTANCGLTNAGPAETFPKFGYAANAARLNAICRKRQRCRTGAWTL